MFSHPPYDPGALPKVLAKIDQAGETLGGVLLFAYARAEGAALREELDRRNVPWVTVNRPREHAIQNFATAEVVRGSRLIARCFAGLGVKRAVFLCNALSAGTLTADKYMGFMQGWLESGCPSRAVDYVATGGALSELAGYEQMKRYLAHHPPPDAVYAAGDFLAIGAMRALREQGVSVGTQTMVVGATGLQVAEYASPSLTVLAKPMEQIGREAARMLLEMHREGVRRMMGRYVPAELVVRDSCPIPAEMIEREREQIEKEA
jgi:LacI family transcriptional regulator